MITFGICDDNPQFIHYLYSHLIKECIKFFETDEEYHVEGAFSSGNDVLEHLEKKPINVLFLDIDMPIMNGFELAQIIRDKHPKTIIVFVSAYDQFVYSSFEYYPFAYLRKDHIVEEFPSVMRRIIDKLQKNRKTLELITNEGEKLIDIKNIVYIESNRNYCYIHLIYDQQYIWRGTLTELEGTLEKYDFFRIHSAFVINLEFVEKIESNSAVTIGNVSLPIAQRRAHDFKDAYMRYTRRCFGT